MTKNRLESFSDGIFAIAATLLVLDINLPKSVISSDKTLEQAMYQSLPNTLTFIFTFLVVGTFWVAHNRIISIVKQVDHFLLWSNVFYLMTIAILPFPAAILSQHPLYKVSIVFYSFILFLCGLQHIIMIIYLHKHTDQIEKNFSKATFNNSIKIAAVGPACYLLAMISCFISPVLSFIFIAGVLVFYIFFAPRIVRNVSFIFQYK
jgi:uncharacterized membrane protein